MGIGLGGIVGGIVGGVAGFSSGGPLGAFAGASAGASFGDALFSDSEDVGGELRAQQLQLAKDQQAEWDKVYGPLQKKLARNLKNMTVASVSALGLEGVEQEFEAAGVTIRQSIAQRGLEGSGLEQEFKSRSAITKAEAKADIRADAPEKIAAAQSSFLSLGIAQKDRESLTGRLLGEEAERADRQASAEGSQLGSILGTAGKVLGASGLLDKKDKPSVVAPKAPIIREEPPRPGETLV